MANSFVPHRTLPESSTVIAEVGHVRPSLYDAKDAFIERVAPIGMAAIYFGSFTLAPQDTALSRQALYKLAFVYRHLLHPGGVRVGVNRQTVIISGAVHNRTLVTLAEILAHQIEGIRDVKDETSLSSPNTAPKKGLRHDLDGARESLQLLFATDQTLRSGVQVTAQDDRLKLEGQVASAAQKNWAEQLTQAMAGQVDSFLTVITPSAATPNVQPPDVDDESLQALIYLRLRLIRETEHLPIRVKADRGIVTMQGKVRTEALRQRVENLARATLGLRELRSSIAISA